MWKYSKAENWTNWRIKSSTLSKLEQQKFKPSHAFNCHLVERVKLFSFINLDKAPKKTEFDAQQLFLSLANVCPGESFK